jgi:hypothetical protein
VSANPWVAFIVVSFAAALQKILALPRENIMPVFFGTIWSALPECAPQLRAKHRL